MSRHHVDGSAYCQLMKWEEADVCLWQLPGSGAMSGLNLKCAA
jgi:hypothetical protein